MKLRYKLPIAFVLTSLVIAGAGLFGIYKLNQAVATYTEVIRIDYGNEQAMTSILVNFKTQVQEWKNVLLRGKDAKQLDKYWAAFQKHERDVADTARKLHASLPDGESRALIAKFMAAHAAMGENYRKGFALFKAANADSAVGDAAVKGMDRAPTELLEQARAGIIASTVASVVRANDSSRQATLISLILMMTGFIGALTGGVLVSRTITRPLSDAVAVANRVADGDLGSSINASIDDEIGELLGALKRMNDNLTGIVGKIRHGTQTIASATSQIAAGNLDLSARTEQHAGSLKETASSMQELEVTVKQNADNARQANQLAEQASNVAVKGGTVVAQVVQTMDAISSSASKIADIIGVIDGIAFQTNILALNAAVEAARAGEQGRGFAVVASEVRTLAQRSAAAAKEIKTLIGDSQESVDAGSKLVAAAGATMEDVVTSVRRVTDIMTNITLASDEQTTSIEQATRTIGQMDQVTQQNVTLVEQATAAAQALQKQAVELMQAVGAFHLAADQGYGLPLPTLRLPAFAENKFFKLNPQLAVRPKPNKLQNLTTRLPVNQN